MAKPLEVLGLPPTATWDEVRAQYRVLAQRHHPDRAGGDIEQFQRIKSAYEALSAKRDETGPFDDIFAEFAKEIHRI
jgi:curved DNA-binding protein CbpA